MQIGGKEQFSSSRQVRHQVFALVNKPCYLVALLYLLMIRKAVGDISNDFRTVLRKLDSMLYLIVKKDRQEHAWQMPQGGVEDNEDLMTVRSC